MNKILPYVAGVLVLGLLGWLIFSTRGSRQIFDERISFNRRDKIPYGLYVAFNNLNRIFPDAHVIINKRAPVFWDSLDEFKGRQIMVAIVPTFRPDEYELQRLVEFIRNGNDVFISTALVSYEVQTALHCEVPDVFEINDNLSLNNNTDSFSVSLANPPFGKKLEFGCPGKRFESYYSRYDSDISNVLGEGIYIMPDLVRFQTGKGSLYLHLTPLAFSNYFLLYRNNVEYYNKVLSLLPNNTKRVIWDEYFLNKRSQEPGSENKSILSALMSQKSFRAALLLLLAILALFIFQEMRRKQRIIPVIAKPRNDSLEFVKTIGRLYYEKKDNKNLCRKMAAYFLEHVRNRYKLATGTLDPDFIKAVQRKTGGDELKIEKIVSFIREMENRDVIEDSQLFEFHKNLEEFYDPA